MSDLQKSAKFIEDEFYTKIDAIQHFCTDFSIMSKVFEMLPEEQLHNYTWNDVTQFIDTLILDMKDVSCIYGVPRGGLILALILSYHSGLPIVSHPCPGCLVVEDACTTGASLLPYYKRYKIACMYAKRDSPISIDYVYETDAKWKGVKFPWQL